MVGGMEIGGGRGEMGRILMEEGGRKLVEK